MEVNEIMINSKDSFIQRTQLIVLSHQEIHTYIYI